MKEGYEKGINIVNSRRRVPYRLHTCSDLFSPADAAGQHVEALRQVIRAHGRGRTYGFVGLPWERGGKLYNMAARGEGREASGSCAENQPAQLSGSSGAHTSALGEMRFSGGSVGGGTDAMGANPSVTISCKKETPGPDSWGGGLLWVPCPPSIRHCMWGHGDGQLLGQR